MKNSRRFLQRFPTKKKKKKMLDTNYSHLRLQIKAFTKQKTKRLNKRVFERRCNFSSYCKRS